MGLKSRVVFVPRGLAFDGVSGLEWVGGWLYDAKSKQLIWRGSVQDTLSDKATKNEKNLDKGVTKMFKGFPPASAKS